MHDAHAVKLFHSEAELREPVENMRFLKSSTYPLTHCFNARAQIAIGHVLHDDPEAVIGICVRIKVINNVWSQGRYHLHGCRFTFKLAPCGRILSLRRFHNDSFPVLDARG